MKKNHVLLASIVLSVIGLSSVPGVAQTPDLSVKSDQDVAKEIAELRQRIHRLELEQQDAKLRDRVHRLEAEKSSAAAPADISVAAGLLPPEAAALGYAAGPRLYNAMPQNAMPQSVPGGGFYGWIDGLYDRVQLPKNVDGGVHIVPASEDFGPLQTFDPRLNTGGVRGAVGYAVPGSDFRIEVGGSYTAGSGSLQNTALPSSNLEVVLLNGINPVGLGCPCDINGMLRTNYDAWKVFGEAKYDAWKFGALTLTATAGLFGGTAEANQDVTQAFLGAATVGTYSSHTSLRWTDVGGRLGLDANYAINPLLSVGLKGWAGLAGRDTSMSGNDFETNNSFGPAGSSVTSSDTKMVFLANLEASFTHSLTSALSIRGFAGFNYDNNMPSISNQAFTAVSILPVQAGISYASEFDYYAGIGMNVKFGNIQYVR